MDLMGILWDKLSDVAMQQIAEKTGLDPKMAKGMTEKALPLLLGQIGKNAQDETKKSALEKVITEKEEITDIAGLDLKNGAKMLGHIFGWSEASTEEKLAKAVGANPSEAKSLLSALAPVVMGQLGGAQTKGMNVSDITGLLQGDVSKTFLTSFLDKDGDGDIKDDLISMAIKYVKKTFSGKK